GEAGGDDAAVRSHGDRLAALVVVASPGVGVLCFAVGGVSGHERVASGGTGGVHDDVAGDVDKVRIGGHVEPGAKPGSADLFPQQVAAAVELDEDDVLLGADGKFIAGDVHAPVRPGSYTERRRLPRRHAVGRAPVPIPGHGPVGVELHQERVVGSEAVRVAGDVDAAVGSDRNTTRGVEVLTAPPPIPEELTGWRKFYQDGI